MNVAPTLGNIHRASSESAFFPCICTVSQQERHDFFVAFSCCQMQGLNSASVFHIRRHAAVLHEPTDNVNVAVSARGVEHRGA